MLRMPLVTLLLGLLLLPGGALCAGAATGHDEERVQAAFLLNFLRFSDGPQPYAQAAEEPLLIGCYCQTPSAALLALTGRTVGGRPLRVIGVDTPAEARRCRLLFIPAAERSQLAKLLEGLEGSATLTVSDIRDFARLGGMIGLVRVGERLRFEVNLAPARQAGIVFSSQLLRLASIVWDKEKESHGP